MQKKIREWQIVGISLILLLVWLIVLNISYTTFQNSRLSDPLAEINALFPHFFILIVIYGLLCLFVYFQKIGGKWLHSFLLLGFAAMLWLTPYLLSGLGREPDGIWHAGTSIYIPEILSEGYAATYATNYPMSYIFNYAFQTITGMDTVIYAGVVFPALMLGMIVIALYCLIAKIFTGRMAFLAMIFIVPSLHYIKLHPSPQTVGVLILLSLLVLLLNSLVRKNIVLIAFMLLILFFTHPISPLIALIFIGFYVLPSYREKIIGAINKKRLAFIILALVVGTITFFFTSVGKITWGHIQRIFKENILETLLSAFDSKFIYSEIYYLNIGLYLLILAICFVLFALLLKEIIKNFRRARAGETRELNQNLSKRGLELKLLTLTLVYFAFGVLLYISTGALTLLERGITFFIIFGAASLISIALVIENKKAMKKVSIAILIVFVLAFPVFSYSVDAYNSVPYSEGVGLEHFTHTTNLTKKSVSITMGGQLLLYINVTTKLSLARYTPQYPTNNVRPDYVVYRNTGYYYSAMRTNMSFSDNAYLESLEIVDGLDSYNKIYESNTIIIFQRNTP